MKAGGKCFSPVMRKSKYVDAVQVIYDNKILAQTVSYQLAKGIWGEPYLLFKGKLSRKLMTLCT